MSQPARASIRLAELLGVLSLAADLGLGQPMEHALRQCLISMRLAQQLGLDEADRGVVYYASLLAWVGCHVDAYEQAKWFGDDTALKSDFRHTDFGPAATRPLFIVRHLGAGRPMAERARLGVIFAGDGRRAAEAMLESTRPLVTEHSSVMSSPTPNHQARMISSTACLAVLACQ